MKQKQMTKSIMYRKENTFLSVVSTLALVWMAAQTAVIATNIAKVAENITRIEIRVTYTTDLEH